MNVEHRSRLREAFDLVGDAEEVLYLENSWLSTAVECTDVGCEK